MTQNLQHCLYNTTVQFAVSQLVRLWERQILPNVLWRHTQSRPHWQSAARQWQLLRCILCNSLLQAFWNPHLENTQRSTSVCSRNAFYLDGRARQKNPSCVRQIKWFNKRFQCINFFWGPELNPRGQKMIKVIRKKTTRGIQTSKTENLWYFHVNLEQSLWSHFLRKLTHILVNSV